MESFVALTKPVFRNLGSALLPVNFPAPSRSRAVAEGDVPKLRSLLCSPRLRQRWRRAVDVSDARPSHLTAGFLPGAVSVGSPQKAFLGFLGQKNVKTSRSDPHNPLLPSTPLGAGCWSSRTLAPGLSGLHGCVSKPLAGAGLPRGPPASPWDHRSHPTTSLPKLEGWFVGPNPRSSCVTWAPLPRGGCSPKPSPS